MSDILLSSEKQSRFESMIERTIEDEFDSEADVLVRSNGRVFIIFEEKTSGLDPEAESDKHANLKQHF